MKQVALLLPLSALPASLLGVYAPIPLEQQEQAWTFNVETGIRYDTNVLGNPSHFLTFVPLPPPGAVVRGPDAEIDSAVYLFNFDGRFNASLTEQTLFSAWYRLKAEEYEDRGDSGDDSLFNHTVGAEINHSFAETLSLSLADEFASIDSPASSIAGIPVRGDQDFDRNRFDLKLSGRANEKTTLAFKYRNFDLSYGNSAIGNLLDRNEHTFGIESRYAYQPEVDLVAEYRYQDINYDEDLAGGVSKDSDSNFFLVGADYQPAPDWEFGARIGIEDRDRDDDSSETSPYARITASYNYAERSFLTAGFTYRIAETSNPISFTDEETYALFSSLQHALSDTWTASASVYFSDAQLERRTGAGATDIDDETFRLGVGLTWQPVERWAFIFDYDYDDITSDSPNREQERHRFGLKARYSFGLR